jgi:hypothetical protein
MPKTKHIATAPDGTIFKRTSQSRTYSHMVIGQRSEERAFLLAHSKRAQVRDGENWDYRQSEANGGGVYGEYANHPAGSWQHNSYERNLAMAKEFIAANPDRQAYIDGQHAERVAAVEATNFNQWFDLGWASREDLAQKNASSHRNNAHWAKVLVVEAKIV